MGELRQGPNGRLCVHRASGLADITAPCTARAADQSGFLFAERAFSLRQSGHAFGSIQPLAGQCAGGAGGDTPPTANAGADLMRRGVDWQRCNDLPNKYP